MQQTIPNSIIFSLYDVNTQVGYTEMEVNQLISDNDHSLVNATGIISLTSGTEISITALSTSSLSLALVPGGNSTTLSIVKISD